MNAAGKVPRGWIIPDRTLHTRHVRGVALTDVQLACGVGEYELDVLVREQLSAPSLQIIGQVTLADRVFEPVANLPMTLLETETPVTNTRTDDFGEFDIVSGRDAVYGLRVSDEQDAACVLVWEGE